VTPVATIRAFLAINLSVPTIRAVSEAQATLRQAIGKSLRVAWVAPANLHLTLKFLGDVAPEVPEAVGDVLQRGLVLRQPFEVRAVGAGAFPDEQRPRVLWVGLVDESGALRALHADVERWMEGLGFAPEPRPFTPHLTLGRIKDGHASVGEALQPLRETAFGTSIIRDVVLYESRLRARGAEYVVLRRAVIGEPPPERRRGPERDTGPRAVVPVEPVEAAPEHETTDTNDTETGNGG
jgi:RNA 2',3'-cyclic 3'-phosphodiesterase